MTTGRLSIRKTDDRMRRLDRAKSLLARDEADDPPDSKVIDAALIHLLESAENLEDARDEFDPRTIQQIGNTSVLKLHYRTSVDQEYR